MEKADEREPGRQQHEKCLAQGCWHCGWKKGPQAEGCRQTVGSGNSKETQKEHSPDNTLTAVH